MARNVGSTSDRVLKRLSLSQVPVRTSIIVAQCGRGLARPRSTVWDSLMRLERNGLVLRETRPVDPMEYRPCCSECGRAFVSNGFKESFWSLVAKGPSDDES